MSPLLEPVLDKEHSEGSEIETFKSDIVATPSLIGIPSTIVLRSVQPTSLGESSSCLISSFDPIPTHCRYRYSLEPHTIAPCSPLRGSSGDFGFSPSAAFCRRLCASALGSMQPAVFTASAIPNRVPARGEYKKLAISGEIS